MRVLSVVIVLLTASPVVADGFAQRLLDEAKSKYEAAAYEEALSALSRTSDAPPEDRAELEQYRAFCLIALGKLADAERAVAALVAADPTYLPSPSVASPKVLALISDLRAKELPAVARRILDAGRTAFKAKDTAGAEEQFDLLLKVLKDPVMKGRPESEDLKSLAEGFTALLHASAPPAAALADRPVAPPAPVVPPSVVPAQVVRESMPAWVPPNTIVATSEFAGSLKLVIGTDGRVKSSSIERPSHPAYDARLLQESRFWVYKPATRDGDPVESERLIDIHLRPR